VLPGRVEKGFHGPKWRDLHPAARGGFATGWDPGPETRRRPRVPGIRERSGPEGGRKGCKRAGRDAARKSKGRRGRGDAPQGPLLRPHPGARWGRQGPAREKEAELTPRSSSERKSGPSSRPSCWVRGPGTPGRGWNGGDTKGDINARPARSPRPPRARRPHRAPGTRHHLGHPPSWLLQDQS
jgi:hypothetical protein